MRGQSGVNPSSSSCEAVCETNVKPSQYHGASTYACEALCEISVTPCETSVKPVWKPMWDLTRTCRVDSALGWSELGWDGQGLGVAGGSPAAGLSFKC